MKYADSLIAYTPARGDYVLDSTRGTMGQVTIGRLLRDGEPDWTDPYMMTCGGAFTRARKLKGERAKLMALIDWHTMVVRDGIDPKLAHKEFLKIDEYRAALAPDLEGADPE
jgi:hypothetical protein